MLRALALSLLCICGLSSFVACVAPRSQAEPAAEHTRADCSACHEREYRSAPQHVDAKPTRCATCHSETSWQPTRLTHAWALTGAHAKADCASCHKGWTPKYEHTTNTCMGCHREAAEKAAAHEAALLSSNCQDCHDTQAWRPARTKPTAQLQLSAASPAPRTAAATNATVATAPIQHANPALSQNVPQRAGITATVGAEPVQRAKAAAGRRARRSELMNRRALDTAPAAPTLEPPQAQVAQPSAAPSPLARGAATKPAAASTSAGKSANPSALQPTAARGNVSTFATQSLRSPEATVSQKSPAEPGLRSQPLAAAGRNKPTRSGAATSQADSAASQPTEGFKPRAASGPAGQAAPPKARTKSPEAAAANQHSK